MLTRIATLALRAPKRVLVLAGILLVGGALFGAPVASHLLTGGFTDPSADSTRATAIIDAKFHGGQANLVYLVSASGGADTPAARTTGQRIEQALTERSDWISYAQSYWDTHDPNLRSKDGRYGLVVAHVKGNDNQIQDRAGTLADQLAHGVDGATVQAGGSALTYHQVNDQTKKDLARAEAIAIPLTAIALILVFGSLVAALVPLAIGIFAIVETLLILRVLASLTDVSVYAMNMTTALGLALAIDYSLFMVSRYREELRAGRAQHDAIIETVRTAGRTVLFSALTVGLSLSALIVFPMYFLRSFAYAGLAVVALAALASIVLLPALLAVIGGRVNALDLRAGLRRLFGRPKPAPRPAERGFWYRLAGAVMRRPARLGLAVAAIFLLLGTPFLRAQFAYPDDRVINSGASARAVGDVLRSDFANDAAAGLVGVAPDTSGGSTTGGDLATYTANVSRIDGVASVTSPAGTYMDGRAVAGPREGLRSTDGTGALFEVATDVDPYSSDGSALVHALRDAPSPWPVLYSGAAAFNVDAMAGLRADLPLAIGLIALATFLVLFLFTGSVVVPLKALVLNTLSLTATFGAMVWIFQDGHLSGLLGFTATGYLVANMVILMFCLAFGMSMDYEVFLLSRIREEWVKSDRTDAANRRAVQLGLARTGRIVTAAAALMAIVFAAMAGSTVAFMQLFGLGLTIAVLADATLVRGILVPAFMRLMGRRNWWAPRPLARLHERIGLHEAAPARPEPSRELELAR